MLLQITDHARCGIQSKCAAACEQNRVNLLHGVGRIEQVCLTRSGRRAAHIHARRCAFAQQQHSATCRPSRFGKVTNGDALHIGNAAARVFGGGFQRRHRGSCTQCG